MKAEEAADPGANDRYVMAKAVEDVEQKHGKLALGGEFASMDDKKRRLRYNAKMYEKAKNPRVFGGGRN